MRNKERLESRLSCEMLPESVFDITGKLKKGSRVGQEDIDSAFGSIIFGGRQRIRLACKGLDKEMLMEA